jgi:hypothetical protein
MSTIPQTLNWVEKRAACNVAQVFNQLCDEIIEDTKILNVIKQLSEDDQFAADMHSNGTTIFISVPTKIPRKRLMIGIDKDTIGVKEEWNGGEYWTARVGPEQRRADAFWS